MLQGLQTSQIELNSVFQYIRPSNLKVKYGALVIIQDKAADVELLHLPLRPHYFNYSVFPFGLMFRIYLTYPWCSKLSEHNKNVNLKDFPCHSVVKNPCNVGDSDLIPGWGTKIPYATGQQSLHTTTREPVCHIERFHMMQKNPKCHN